jgi:hypothetical protein
MRTSIVFAIVVLMSVPVVGAPVQKEIFGIYEPSGSGSGPFQIYRYDVTAGTFHDCGLNEPPWTNGYNTNLAMDNNRRLYYMNPNTGSQVIYQADLDSGNNLINQVPLVTLNPQIGLIDGFTIGPDQNPDILTCRGSFLTIFWPRFDVEAEGEVGLGDDCVAGVELVAQRHHGFGVAWGAELIEVDVQLAVG